MRSNVSSLSGLDDIRTTVSDKTLRFKFDSKAVSLQRIVNAVKGEGGKYDARLLLQLVNEPTGDAVTRLKEALGAVVGVRAVSEPNGDRIFTVTFKPDSKTFLDEILNAAESVGVPVKNPPLKQVQ